MKQRLYNATGNRILTGKCSVDEEGSAQSEACAPLVASVLFLKHNVRGWDRGCLVGGWVGG